jgi:hypothetical protein
MPDEIAFVTIDWVAHDSAVQVRPPPYRDELSAIAAEANDSAK